MTNKSIEMTAGNTAPWGDFETLMRVNRVPDHVIVDYWTGKMVMALQNGATGIREVMHSFFNSIYGDSFDTGFDYGFDVAKRSVKSTAARKTRNMTKTTGRKTKIGRKTKARKSK